MTMTTRMIQSRAYEARRRIENCRPSEDDPEWAIFWYVDIRYREDGMRTEATGVEARATRP